jgi:uncharacterized protein YgbK (DUF1537 family)
MDPEPVRLIVADDLTGAADACVRLVRHGQSAAVLPDLDAVTPALADRADVVSISVDTRRRPRDAARSRVERAARLAGARAAGQVLLKVDSTLRGHLGEEIAAALDAFSCTHAILTPAFPAMNRRLVNGQLRVSGLGAPAPVDVRTRLASQGLPGAALLSPPYGATSDVMVDAMQRARAAGARVFVADAADDRDLERTVAAGRAAGGRPLWVGSAGLAQALAVEIGATGALPQSDRPLPPHDRLGPIFVCIGSVHPATRAQEARLASRSRARVLRLTSDTWSATRGMLQTLSGESIAGLVLTGGDTATTVCAALGVEAVDLGGEVASGVPWGVVSGGHVDGAPIVLKSGAFGGESTLVDAVDFLSATMGRRLTQTDADGHSNAQ